MRLGLATLAVVLATVLVPLGITSTWLSLRVDNTESYVDTVAPLADDRDLRDALADEVAEAAVAALTDNVPAALLPPSLDTGVRAATQRVVENDGFPEFWRKANADAHEEFLAIVHDRDKGVVADGYVFIDVGPLLDEVLADFIAAFRIGSEIELPPQSLMVPVVPESKLEQGRGAYQALDFLAFWVPLGWVALVAFALVVARGLRGRLRTGAAAAFGAAIGGGLVLLLTSPVTNAVVDQVEPERQDLARLVVEVVVDSLDGYALTATIVGLVVGAVLMSGSFLTPRSRQF